MRSQGGEGGRHTSAPRNDSTNDLGEPGKSYRIVCALLDSVLTFFLLSFFTLIFFYFRFFFWLYFWLFIFEKIIIYGFID